MTKAVDFQYSEINFIYKQLRYVFKERIEFKKKRRKKNFLGKRFTVTY